MFKVIKVYLKNSKDLQNQEIYCIRLNFNEGLEFLKNKIFMRCPQLKNHDPQIYWLDLENDKIRITCDDDLKFFMEESPCQKLIFDFRQATDLELSRKRSCSQLNDDASECSKKIRKQLQDFDLSSDSSSMDTDGDDEGNMSTSIDTSKNSSVSDVSQVVQDDPVPSTSTAGLDNRPQSPNVNIISVDIIVDDAGTSDKRNEVEIVEVTQTREEESVQQSSQNGEVSTNVAEENTSASSTTEEPAQQEQPKKQVETNRILISDSSDDESEDNANNNNDRRRYSDGPFASSYSFTNVDGNVFESRTYCGGRNGGRHYHSQHRFRNNFRHSTPHGQNFEEHSRNFQRMHSENMERMQQQARMAREQAARAREQAARARDQAARAVRASAAAIPDLVSTFQAHFRPLFRVADINQHIFGNSYRR